MLQLPASPDLFHLKKQAKHLLRDAHEGDPASLQRFLANLPAIRNLEVAALANHQLHLHDAQSVVAREYGFRSWTELKHYVEWQQTDRAERLAVWLNWAYEGNARERRLALRMLREEPAFFSGDPSLACTLGDAAAVQAAIDNDPGFASHPGFVNIPGGPRKMPPLVAVTHSRLILEEGFEARLLACAGLLLQHGADPNATWTNPDFPDWPLSALYGAAGRNHNAAMTSLLLQAGASTDDNESLYHSVESRESTCTRLLLDAGARVAGTNAIAHLLDYDKLDDLKRMLHHGNLQNGNDGKWMKDAIHHAILHGRSIEHIRALIDAGADFRAPSHDGTGLYTWAQMHGRVDVVELLREAGIEGDLTLEEQFVAACARGDEAAASAILGESPQIFSRLSAKQLQALPELASVGELNAVRTMLNLGWPREIKAGWSATALNHAVYRGDAVMAELLLSSGADWRTQHGFKDNVLGTLSHASQDEPAGEPSARDPRDYIGCARVLIEHGVPISAAENYGFSPEVAEYFDLVRLSAG